MAGIDVSITISEDVSAAIGRLIAAGGDLTRPMKDLAGHLADETRERFETGTGPDGRHWKPSRRVLGIGTHGPLNGQTLVDTGDLLSSITEDWGKDYAATGPEKSGGAAVYAAIHQFGGKIVPKKGREGKDGKPAALRFGGRYLASVTIPARPYLGFTDADGEYALQALADHLSSALGGGAGSVA